MIYRKASTKRRLLALLPAILGILGAHALPAQPIQPAAAPPEMERLAFLVGSWDNHSRFFDVDGKLVREMSFEDLGAQAQELRLILGGWVIEGGAGSEFARVWYLYRPLEKRYVWTAVDLQGNYEIAYGTFEDGRLVFTNPAPRPWHDGGTIMWRRTYQKIEPDSREILMEYSRDGGSTWVLSNIQTERRVGSETKP